jgi:exonuclease III
VTRGAQAVGTAGACCMCSGIGKQACIASFTPSLTRHLGARLDALLSHACRVVITDHSHFVLVNVYVPNAGDRPDRPRLQYKLRFLEALKQKCDALVAQGREVRGLAAGWGWCCRCG